MVERIGITLGDPAGIGYEITAKALRRYRDKGRFTLIGNAEHFRSVLGIIGSNMDEFSSVNFVDIDGGSVDFGRVQKEAGRISYESVVRGIELAMNGEIDSLVTAPINKEAWQQAGSKFIDHTTMLQVLTGSGDVGTVFEVKKLRIIFMTKHISLIEACRQVTRENVKKGIAMADQALKMLRFENGKIAVAALNPHGGEGGLFGREEIDEIIPAVNDMKKIYNVYGPFPADSVFYQASLGSWDIVLSLYHDQGHIAAKTYDFRRTVSLNIGLPFLRTTVDHGTAFDIAGKGIADETSMLESIKKAIKYSSRYRENYSRYFKKSLEN